MRIGVTGHRHLDKSSAWGWVATQIENILRRTDLPLIGSSCLAVGTDQVFAEVVLSLGGTLEVIVPFQGYERCFTSGSERERYLELLGRACSHFILPNSRTEEDSYLEAGKLIVDSSELLIAVWNALPARGRGGTAEVVAYAMSRARKVIHLNPETREIECLGV
jgi:hypothetical protein